MATKLTPPIDRQPGTGSRFDVTLHDLVKSAAGRLLSTNALASPSNMPFRLLLRNCFACFATCAANKGMNVSYYFWSPRGFRPCHHRKSELSACPPSRLVTSTHLLHPAATLLRARLCEPDCGHCRNVTRQSRSGCVRKFFASAMPCSPSPGALSPQSKCLPPFAPGMPIG